MSVRSKSQRAAEARYDKKRQSVAVTIRISPEQAEWLNQTRRPDESRAAAIKRLIGLPGNDA